MIRFVILCLALLFTSVPSLAQSDVTTLIESGNTAFDEAAAIRETDPPRANELLGAAIDNWSDAMRTGSYENGLLHYNIANAHLLRDDVGLAILHYRRADELIPGDRRVLENLSQARLRVRGGAIPEASSGALETILFFHTGMTERTRFISALAAFALCWLVAGLVVWRVLPRGALWFSAIAGVVWISAGSSLAIDALSAARPGVIVGADITGRKGPDANGYEPSFTRSLSAGVEFTLIEQRGEWLLIRLADDRKTWIPRSSARLLDSLAH